MPAESVRQKKRKTTTNFNRAFFLKIIPFTLYQQTDTHLTSFAFLSFSSSFQSKFPLFASTDFDAKQLIEAVNSPIEIEKMRSPFPSTKSLWRSICFPFFLSAQRTFVKFS